MDIIPIYVYPNLGIVSSTNTGTKMAVCQNLVPLVNIKIAGKWMFIPLKMVLIGIDPYPNDDNNTHPQFFRVHPLLPPLQS